MPREFPAEHSDPMLDPYHASQVEGADAPEDQAPGRRTLVTKGRKKAQVLVPITVIVFLVGIILVVRGVL
jgi:hypothetical protein